MRNIFAACFIAGLLACASTAQRGNLQYAIEMLNNCNFAAAAEAARDVRSIGAPDSPEATTSLLIEARAVELGGGDADALYEAFASRSPNLESGAQARDYAEASIEPLTRECK